MQIGARTAAWSGGKMPTARDYVRQSDLLHMWDGIENAGWGIHDGTIRGCKDLIGSIFLDKNMGSLGDNCVIGRFITEHFDISAVNGELTIEIVSSAYSAVVSTYSSGSFVAQNSPLYSSGNNRIWMLKGGGGLINPPPSKIINPTVAFRLKNGVQDVRCAKTKYTLNGESNTSLIYNSTFNCRENGVKTYAIRVSGVYLTDDEIDENWEIDKARFGLT